MLTNRTYQNAQYRKHKDIALDILIQRKVLEPDKRDRLQTAKLIKYQ